ncbi:MAG TPA: hypothetical protein VEV37_07990, partial [Bryobacteraceae bacterium]|nr:hypothetical protein [Bryobacteraceae bacterium]
MAGSFAILSALARSVWRDLRTFGSVGGNNLMLFMLLVMYQQPQSGVFFLMILAVLMLGPLSGDPFRKIPRDRLALWPLAARERVALRVGSLALSPVVWVAIVFLFWTGGWSLGLVLMGGAVLMQAAGDVWGRWREGRLSAQRGVALPKFPGRWGGLVQKNLRQMLSVLDCYAALVLAVGGAVYRLAGAKADPDA